MDLTEFDQIPDRLPLVAALDREQLLWRGVALAALSHPKQDLEVHCAPFARDEYGHWQVSRWVGAFNLGGETYRILPRVGEARFNLMACSALFAAVIKRRGEAMGAEHTRLRDFVLSLVWFISFRAGLLRHNLPRTYVRRESEESDELLGNLELERQLTENFLERQRIACSWDDLTVNNPINQASQLVISHLRRHRRFPYAGYGGEARRELDSWRERFPLMGVTMPLRFPSERVRWSRANDGFRAAHHLARSITQDQGLRSGGQRQEEAVFIDTAEVWELYLRERLRGVVRALFPDYRVDWPREARADYLLDWEGRPVRGLIPDFRILRNRDDQVIAILDAKYRRYRPLTDDREVATQMALYVVTAGLDKNTSHPPSALIYPRAQGFNDGFPRGRLGDGHLRMRDRPSLLAWAIELGSPSDETQFHASVDQQLGELLSILVRRRAVDLV